MGACALGYFVARKPVEKVTVLAVFLFSSFYAKLS